MCLDCVGVGGASHNSEAGQDNTKAVGFTPSPQLIRSL